MATEPDLSEVTIGSGNGLVPDNFQAYWYKLLMSQFIVGLNGVSFKA